MKKIVKGDIFIIPNEKVKIEKFFTPEAEKRQFSKATGYEIKDDDELVHVWVTSDSTNNWQCCHGGWLEECQLRKEYGFRDLFPGYFPVRILENLTEGDVLECFPQGGGDVKIELTCRQKDYRYSRFGTFEECLRNLP